MSGATNAAALALAQAVQAVAEAVRAAANDPADQIRLLIALANYYPAQPVDGSATGARMGVVQDATGALCRRAALAALGRATSAYQPSSYQDAIALRARVCDLLDAEITIAGDTGDDAAYGALRALRSAIANDLTTRAAQLPYVITVSTPASVPALTAAYRLYRDASRAPDIVARADPVHPAFMPREFQALSQ